MVRASKCSHILFIFIQTSKALDFYLQLIVSTLFIVIPAAYTYIHDRHEQKKYHQPVFFFSIVGALIAAVTGFKTNAKSDRNERIAQQNDSLYKVQLNRNLNNSELIIDTLNKQLGTTRQLLTLSQVQMRLQINASVMLTDQLRETENLLVTSRGTLENSNLTLYEFSRLNNKLENIRVEAFVEYILPARNKKQKKTIFFDTRLGLKADVGKLTTDIYEELTNDSLHLDPNSFIVDSAMLGAFPEGNSMRMGTAMRNGYPLQLYTYKDLIVQKMVRPTDSLLHIVALSDREGEAHSAYRAYFPAVSAIMLNLSKKYQEPPQYLSNYNAEYYGSWLDSLSLAKSRYNGVNFIEKRVTQIITMDLRKQKNESDVISIPDLKNCYLTVGFHHPAKLRIRELTLFCGENYLRKIKVPLNDIVFRKGNVFVIKLK
jgi:hypothetical protein